LAVFISRYYISLYHAALVPLYIEYYLLGMQPLSQKLYPSLWQRPTCVISTLMTCNLWHWVCQCYEYSSLVCLCFEDERKTKH